MEEETHKEKTRMRFDGWAKSYERSVLWRVYFKPLHRKINGLLGEISGLSVLDIGCGTGNFLRELKKRNPRLLTGVDISESMLEIARELSSGTDIKFIRCDAENLPFDDESFDIVTSTIAFHHFENPKRVLSETYRVLKSSGRVVISDLSGEGLASRLFLAFGKEVSTDRKYYERDEITSLLRECGFFDACARRIWRFPPTFLATGYK